MSLQDYGTHPDDEFALDDKTNVDGFCFPCSCCTYRSETDKGPHCIRCAHNANWEKVTK